MWMIQFFPITDLFNTVAPIRRNERVIANRTSMQHGLMTDRHSVSNGQGDAGVGMQDDTILNIAPRSNNDGFWTPNQTETSS
jgi:hypothetical protein